MICRKIKDRPRDPAKWNEIADVVSALSIPVIANGDIFEYDDFRRIQDATGLLINNSFIFHFEKSNAMWLGNLKLIIKIRCRICNGC